MELTLIHDKEEPKLDRQHRHIRKAYEQGSGVLKLMPTWVPRSFCIPGRRLRLHPDDYYALGAVRGGINERWLSSTTKAVNGPLTGEHEGLSKVLFEDGNRRVSFLLQDAVEELQGELIGTRLWNRYGGWPMYAKFFDNVGSLPHHVHHSEEMAKLIGQQAKAEAYYFPPQMNNHKGLFPYTFMGIVPGTTPSVIEECLRRFSNGDNKITNYSQAFRLEVGTGWDVPPGLLHAPGSMCTYEPQQASDVFAMFQSLVNDLVIPEDLLWHGTPQDRIGDIDALMELLDWELNTDPNLYQNRFMLPIPVEEMDAMIQHGYIEKWVCYRSAAFSAKEFMVLPGASVKIKDHGSYGLIVLQGRGTLGNWEINAPVMIRFNDITNDEFFVSDKAAEAGVLITNRSSTEPLVMLKHFGPGNTGLAEKMVEHAGLDRRII